jgi:hypothetical protein
LILGQAHSGVWAGSFNTGQPREAIGWGKCQKIRQYVVGGIINEKEAGND